MLIQLMMAPLMLLIKFLIDLLPVMATVPKSFVALLNIVGYGCAFIGTDFFLSILGNITFWLTTQLAWSIIEWVYKKVPGVK